MSKEKDLLSLEELCLLGISQDHVLGNELVVRDVHKQLFLHEHLKVERLEALQRLNKSEKMSQYL